MNRFAKILKPLLVFVFFIVTSVGYAQINNTLSKKAIKFFQKSRQEFLNENYDKAMLYVNKALHINNYYADAILLKVDISLELSLSSHAYDETIELLEFFVSLDDCSITQRNYAERQLALLCFRKEMVENPVCYNPENIGADVNTNADEYINQYYLNDDKIIFTKRYKSDMHDDLCLYENVFVTTNDDSVWTTPKVLLADTINLGAANISFDGNEIYFSGCGWESGMGSCDIYYMKFKDNNWSKPINIKTINTSEWESQPCLSYDGKELYFVRGDKKTGTSDIYVSKRDDEGKWMKPIKINSNINTNGNEMAPFIHHDGKTLYFSSDGHWGMGGFDLFMSQRNSNGEWQKAVNLGYPLNTYGDEINVVVLNDAKKAYMSAIRNEGYGNYDIYEFALDERFRPEMIEIKKPSTEEYYAHALAKQGNAVLKNIYFEFDSAELSPESDDGIIAVFDFLTINPDIVVLLEGHTDDVGNEEYNLKLSERRAEAVKAALVEKGISSDRIKTKGCGSSQPLSTNNFDDELKTLNRRVSMSFVD